MGRKFLNGLIFILALGLLMILITSDRGISGVMEVCGSYSGRSALLTLKGVPLFVLSSRRPAQGAM